jgi:hypothetical protein
VCCLIYFPFLFFYLDLDLSLERQGNKLVILH